MAHEEEPRMRTPASTRQPAFLYDPPPGNIDDRRRHEAYVAAERRPQESYREADARLSGALRRADQAISNARLEADRADMALLTTLVNRRADRAIASKKWQIDGQVKLP
jgi:hypothetical protein